MCSLVSSNIFMANHWPLGVPSCQRTVAFEKACILFNLAAVYTQIATKQDRGSEKGLDMAVDNFLRAAGIFKHIHETFTNAPSVDLKPEFLEILVAMMLAQARECLYEKLLLQIETFSIANKSHVSESKKKITEKFEITNGRRMNIRRRRQRSLCVTAVVFNW